MQGDGALAEDVTQARGMASARVMGLIGFLRHRSAPGRKLDDRHKGEA
jgi:hypothetical protein